MKVIFKELIFVIIILTFILMPAYGMFVRLATIRPLRSYMQRNVVPKQRVVQKNPLANIHKKAVKKQIINNSEPKNSSIPTLQLTWSSLFTYFCNFFSFYNNSLPISQKIINEEKEVLAFIKNKDQKTEKRIIKYIKKNDPDNIRTIFNELIKNEWGCDLVAKIINEDRRGYSRKFIPLVKEQFSLLCKTSDGHWVLTALIKHNPERSLEFASFITKEQLMQLSATYEGRLFLLALVEGDPNVAEELIPVAFKMQLNQLCKTDEGCLFLATLIENNSDAAQQCAAIACDQKFYSPFIFHTLMQNISKKEDREKLIEKVRKEDDSVANIIISLMYDQKNSDFHKKEKLEIPSFKHIHQNVRSVVQNSSCNAVLNDQQGKNMINKVLKKEKELNDAGYYTFYHGQRFNYGIVEKWLALLEGIKKEVKVDNFLKMHIKKMPTNKKYLLQEKAKRERLVRNGNTKYNGEDRQNILFATWALFGNTTNESSNAVHYMLHNDNKGSIGVSLKEAFIAAGFEGAYGRFENELIALEEKYNQLSEHGQLIQIAIPKDILEECVYLTKSGGPKESLYIDGIGYTDHIKTIMDTLYNHPEKIENTDQLEFAIVMTEDEKGGLNPKSGIKYFAFNTVEAEKWSAFLHEEKTLFKKIENDIIASKSNKNVYNFSHDLACE